MRRVEDYADRVPAEWREQGGVFLPMYQREAMWILLSGQHWKPRAVKVGIGKVCALTGRRWTEGLESHPQNYMVTPPQPWLDGIAVGKGLIRQFVAMPLGMGYTVEGQVTGEERFGGIQIKVFEPRPGRFAEEPPAELEDRCAGELACEDLGSNLPCCKSAAAPRRSRAMSMGLAAGGRMKQKIYPDPHGIDTWDPYATTRVFVHIVNSDLWREITGEEAPATPVTAASYSAYGLPWFDLYDEGMPTLEPSATLTSVKSVKEMDQQKFGQGLQDDGSVKVGPVKKLWVKVTKGLGVRDCNW